MLIKIVTGGLLLVGALWTPGLATAQDARLDLVRKAVPTADFAAARADADAKANNRATLDNNVDVRNKLGQKQAATGIGLGKSTAVSDNTNTLKSENTNTLKTGDVTNVNTLKTGDVTNINTNANKQIQTFGFPLVRRLDANGR